MDAKTFAALMLKAKRVFATDQTFLSFPLTPLPFSPKQLDFFDDSTPAALDASIRAGREFSRLVNMVPTGEAWQPTGSDFLWDIYLSVLSSAQLATSTRNAAEEATYAKARAFLRTPEGDSAAVVAYNRCRDAFLLAEQRYKNAELTAQCGDEAARRDWKNTTEPALRAELSALEQRWVLEGQKNEVETAKSQVQALGARSPWLTWDEWKTRCDPELDVLSSPEDTSTVFTSGYTPANATAEGAWQAFTLEAAEIDQLLSEAPASWRARLPSGGGQSNGVDFEFSSAGVVRSWFDADLFKARFWRFEDARQVSNGANPPAGECPAYIAGVVFARHVRERAPAAASTTAAPVGNFKGFEFVLAKQGLRLQTQPIQAAVRANQVAAVSPRIANVKVAAPTKAVVSARTLTAARPMVAAANLRAPVVAQPAIKLTAQAVRKEPLAQPQAAALQRMRQGSVERVLLDRAVPAPAPSTPKPAPAQDDTIFILAFICKPVPQCPNPDLALTW